MICVAFAASFSYVLPVSTPPNAIVYAYARFTLMEMVTYYSGMLRQLFFFATWILQQSVVGNFANLLVGFSAWKTS